MSDGALHASVSCFANVKYGATRMTNALCLDPHNICHLSDQGQDVRHHRHHASLPLHHHHCRQNHIQEQRGHSRQGHTLHLPPPHQCPH